MRGMDPLPSPLGPDAPDVGPICLGCMNFGTRVPQERAFAILDRFVERGGELLDTANNYAFWEPAGTGDESEALLGRWLRSRGCRDEVLLATKVGARPTVPGTGFETAEGLSAQAIRDAIEGSLRRLGVERVDLYYAHVDDRGVDQRETLAAFSDIVAQGKARAMAASNFHAWRLALARAISAHDGLETFGSVQQRYSYLQPRPGSDLDVQVAVDEALLDLCAHDGLPIFAYSPLLSGAYTRPEVPLHPEYRTADNDRRLMAARRVAADAGLTANQVVLAWLRQSPAARVIPVVAASSTDQLDESLDAIAIRLTAEQVTALDEAPFV